MRTKYIIIIFFLFSGLSLAFDSEREGIVVGGGIGYSPNAYTEVSGSLGSRVSTSGIAGSLIAGYGYNENTLFLLMLEGLQSNTHVLNNSTGKVKQGFTGFGVRFYFDEIGHSFFISSGIGLQHYITSEKSEFAHDSGLGYLAGVGYEFLEHFQVMTTMTNGRTKDSFRWNHVQFIMTVSVILY